MTDLPSIEPVRSAVQSLASGRRKIRFFHVAAVTALVLAIALAVVAWFVAPATTGWLALGVAVTSLVVGGAAAALLPVDTVAVAKRYDDRVGTKDLLSSSLELERGTDTKLGSAFVAAVREEAQQATGRASAGEIYPASVPVGAKWLPAPLVACLVPLFIDWQNYVPPEPPSQEVREVLDAGAAWLEQILDRKEDQLASIDASILERVKNASNALREEQDKRAALAELARLASQLDKERKDLENRKLELEKNASKLARGEDARDAKRDMDAGRYREAANKVKKKIGELEKELEKKQEQKAAKVEIEKLKQRIQKLRELLAELEQLDALGQELGFLVETMEALERIEGRLGELGEFDGQEFGEAQLGRMRKPRQAQDGEKPDKLLVMPSNESGKGHVKKLLGDAKRALSDGDELEARLREGKGKSSYGQVRTANDGSRSRTGYNEALLAAKRAADDAIYRQNIPIGYRNYIRRYFETMQPDDRAADSGR